MCGTPTEFVRPYQKRQECSPLTEIGVYHTPCDKWNTYVICHSGVRSKIAAKSSRKRRALITSEVVWALAWWMLTIKSWVIGLISRKTINCSLIICSLFKRNVCFYYLRLIKYLRTAFFHLFPSVLEDPLKGQHNTLLNSVIISSIIHDQHWTALQQLSTISSQSRSFLHHFWIPRNWPSERLRRTMYFLICHIFILKTIFLHYIF